MQTVDMLSVCSVLCLPRIMTSCTPTLFPYFFYTLCSFLGSIVEKENVVYVKYLNKIL